MLQELPSHHWCARTCRTALATDGGGFDPYDTHSVKGKPCESRGRKVIGLKGVSPKAAGLPVEVGC